MKILIDQNISFRLITQIEQALPQLFYVKNLDLTNASDHHIFRFILGYIPITIKILIL
jgi:predicted nuclease of predicted toxin-antitoxin system